MLGALPLLIAGIHGYSGAMEKIQRARKYRSTLSQYNDELMSEGLVLQNTWFKIVRLGQDAIIQRFPDLSLEGLRKNPHKTMAAYNIPLKTILLLALPDCNEQGLEVIVRTFDRLYELVATLAETFDVSIDPQESAEVCSTKIVVSIVNPLRSQYLSYNLQSGMPASRRKCLQKEVKKPNRNVKN